MRKMRALRGGLAVLLTATLIGCQGAGTETAAPTEAAKAEETAKAETEQTPEQQPREIKKIGLILSTGGLGDKNFNDMAYAGIVKAQEELGIEFDYVEPASASDFLSLDTQFAETGEYDLIIAMGTDQMEAIKETAIEFPDQKITLIDALLEQEGVSCVQTRWSEQTFLSGVIAGLVTKQETMTLANPENAVGIILGIDLPNLREGQAGFISGVKYVNPECEVLEATVGAFNDPGKGKEIALSMYSRGADVIQHVAGGSGLGVFNAAKEAGRYAIGVGANQNGEEPDYILATSVRNVDEMIYNEIKALVDGTWQEGLHISGLKEGAVGCSTENSNIEIDSDTLAIVEEIKQSIVDGELIPCDNLDELDTWITENQYY